MLTGHVNIKSFVYEGKRINCVKIASCFLWRLLKWKSKLRKSVLITCFREWLSFYWCGKRSFSWLKYIVSSFLWYRDMTTSGFLWLLFREIKFANTVIWISALCGYSFFLFCLYAVHFILFQLNESIKSISHLEYSFHMKCYNQHSKSYVHMEHSLSFLTFKPESNWTSFFLFFFKSLSEISTVVSA